MRFGRAGRDDADTVTVDLDMDHEQQPRGMIEADGGIPDLVLTRGIGQHQQGVEEYGRRILKTDAVPTQIARRLSSIPDEVIAANAALHVHA